MWNSLADELLEVDFEGTPAWILRTDETPVEEATTPRGTRFIRVERGEGGPQGGNATQRFPLTIEDQRPSVGCSIKWKE